MKKITLRFGLLILGIFFSLIAYYLNTDFAFIFGLFGLVFILVGLLVASRSSMLGFGGNLQTINGIGTKLYGRSNFDKNDKSYTATKWLVFLWLPIIPLASYRVIDGEVEAKFLGTQQKFQSTDIPLDKMQVIKIYLTVYGLFILLGVFLYLTN